MSRKVFHTYWAFCSALMAISFGFLAAGVDSGGNLGFVICGFVGSVSLAYYASWIVQRADEHGVPNPEAFRSARSYRDPIN